VLLQVRSQHIGSQLRLSSAPNVHRLLHELRKSF
jgi:hypothetical protein